MGHLGGSGISHLFTGEAVGGTIAMVNNVMKFPYCGLSSRTGKETFGRVAGCQVCCSAAASG